MKDSVAYPRMAMISNGNGTTHFGSGYVYILKVVGHNVYKIGSSIDPEARKNKLELGKSYQIEFSIVIYTDKSCDQLEMRLQSEFSKRQISGEWYVLTESDLQSIREKYHDQI